MNPVWTGERLHKENRRTPGRRAIRLFLSFQLFLNWLKFILFERALQGIPSKREESCTIKTPERVLKYYLINQALQGIPDFLIGEGCNAQKTPKGC